jgi:hypothetical protein
LENNGKLNPSMVILAVAIIVIFPSFGVTTFIAKEAFGAVDFNKIDVTSTETLLFEGIDTNVIVVKLNITNNANEEFDTSYYTSLYLVSSTGSYFTKSTDYNDIIGDKTCPQLDPIPAGITKEVTLCYITPKNLLTSFSLKITEYYKEYCDEASNDEYIQNCQEITTAIKNPIKTDYDEYKKKFISINTDIDAKFKSIDLIEQYGFNILKIDFDLTNLSSTEINFSSENVVAITPDGTEYTSNLYDLTDLGYDYDMCNQDSININPKLTKSYSYCFEVPQEYRTFDLSIRNTDFDDCDSGYIQCSEYLLNISNPKFIALEQPEPPIPELTTSDNVEPEAPKETKTFSFVDSQKDPWSYVSRYKNEPEYKEWFDTSYPDTSIYEAVGLKNPLSFVDPIKDPQSYVNRYNNEPEYKEWFDTNFPGYSIYYAVGIPIPKIDESNSEPIEPVSEPPPTQNNIKNLDMSSKTLGLKVGQSIKYKVVIDISSSNDFVKKSIESLIRNNDFNGVELLNVKTVEVKIKDVSHSKVIIEKTYEMIDGSISTFESTKKLDEFLMPSYFIPIDLNQGEQLFAKDDGSEFVLQTKINKKYDGKSFSAWKIVSENSINTDGTLKKDSYLGYYDEETGMLLEDNNEIAIVDALMQGVAVNMNFKAIDITIPQEKGGGCLIATATYGSELAPQVQQLRELRDNKLLNTESGSTFMKGFNDFYYSFSPTIADLERENPVFKEAVKIAITPMLSTLSILNYVDTDSEINVLGYGISLIILNLGMYVGIPVFAIMSIRKGNS